MREEIIEERPRNPEEYAFYLDFADDFIAVRVDVIDGQKMGILIGHGEDQGKVDALIEADQVIHPKALYHVFDPLDYLNMREGRLIGGDDK